LYDIILEGSSHKDSTTLVVNKALVILV